MTKEPKTGAKDYSNLLTKDEVVFLYELGEYMRAQPTMFRATFELNVEQPIYTRSVELEIGLLSWNTDSDFYLPGLILFAERLFTPKQRQRLFLTTPGLNTPGDLRGEFMFAVKTLSLVNTKTELETDLVGYANLNINSTHDLLNFLHDHKNNS